MTEQYDKRGALAAAQEARKKAKQQPGKPDALVSGKSAPGMPESLDVSVEKERLKTELRSVYEAFIFNLELHFNTALEKFYNHTDDDYLNTKEKIEEAKNALGSYRRGYDVELTFLQSKEKELSGALGTDEVSAIKKEFEQNLGPLALARKNFDGDMKLLLEKEAELSAPSQEAPPVSSAEAAVGTAELAPVSAPGLPEVEQETVVVVSLDASRKNYVKAKRELEKFSGLVGSLKGFFSKSSKDKIEQEHKKAQEVYDIAQSEYVGTSFQRTWDEKNKLTEEKFAQYLPERGAIKKLYDGYKKLGEWNLTNLYEKGFKQEKIENKWMRAGLNAVNVRNAISISLMSYGWLGARVGVSTASVLGTVVARRALGGIGYYDLQNMVLDKGRDKLSIKKHLKQNADLKTLSADLDHLEARALLDGKTLEKLQQEELYKELRQKVEELSKDYFSSLEGQQLKAELNTSLANADASFDKSVKNAKTTRRVVGGVSAVIAGGMISSTISEYHHAAEAAKAVKHAAAAGENLHNDPAPQFKPQANTLENGAQHNPAFKGGNPALEQTPASAAPVVGAAEHLASQRVNLPQGAWVETTPDGGLQIHAGGRGIEGALLDLEKANKPMFDKMMDVLKNDPKIGHAAGVQITDPGKLVHRYVDAFAKQHDYNISEGLAHDLSRMSEAQLHVDASGHINFDTEHLKFLDPLHHAAETNPHEAIAPESQAAVEYTDAADSVQNDIVQTSVEAQNTAADVMNNNIHDAGQFMNDGKWHHFGGDDGGGSSAEVVTGNHAPGSTVETHTVDHHTDADSHDAGDNVEKISRNESGSISQALDTKDLTKSLKLVYGDQYTKLFKLGHFKPSDLKKIQNMRLPEFLDHCAKDHKFGKKFKFLHDAVVGDQESRHVVGTNETIKKFLIKNSSDIKEDLKGFN